MDRQTREVVGLYIGNRSRESATKLWRSLPPVCFDFPSATLRAARSSAQAAQVSGKPIHLSFQRNVIVLLAKVQYGILFIITTQTLHRFFPDRVNFYLVIILIAPLPKNQIAA